MGKKITDIPHMLKMWDGKLNKDAPEDVSVHLEEVRYWRCPDCGYSWQSSVKARYRSSGKCPCHESNKAIMKGVNDALTIVKGLRELLDDDNDLDALSTQGVDSSMPINLYCRECGRKWTVDLRNQIRKVRKGEYIAVGCPHYNTVKRKKEDVPFCIEVESLARFWDPSNPMDPAKTRSNSTQKAHFICKDCGYDWTTEIRGQTRGTGKCRCCELHLVTRKGHTDLFTLIPESKDYYDFELNKNIDVQSLNIRNDDILINWKCPDCGYRWKSTTASRIVGKDGSYRFRSCQRCYTTRIKPVASNKKLVKYWDFKKNIDLDINLTSVHSCNSAYWRCRDCGHEWSGTIKWMSSKDGTCPSCAGRKHLVIKGKNDVLTLCPEIASIYDFEKNEGSGIDIYRLSPNSKTEAFFKCQKCGNEWKSPVSYRVRAKDGGFGLVDCPVCSNKSFRKIPYSVQYPDIAAMYMDDMNIVPLDGIVGANGLFKSYYYWKCPNCNEVFSSTLNSMIQSYNYPTKGCPYCSHTRLRKGMSFGDIHPELVKEYSPHNETDIYNVFPSSHEIVKWECSECGNEWETTFDSRHRGNGKCPVCFKCGRNLNTESVASRYPELVKLWSPNNERTPYNTFYTSNYLVHWICPVCKGDYLASVNEMENGYTCPYCNDRQPLKGFNSFGDRHPELLSELYALGNCALERSPFELLSSSKVQLWWVCPNDKSHKYKMSPNTRLMFQKRSKQPCLYCRGHRRNPNYFMDYNGSKKQNQESEQSSRAD